MSDFNGELVVSTPYWGNLNNGQRVKALDDIWFINNGSINFNQTNEVHITGTQLKHDLILVAKKGDIGVWDWSTKQLEFSRINDDNQEVTNDIDFSWLEDAEDIVDPELFELVD